jgi:hypothetical protein
MRWILAACITSVCGFGQQLPPQRAFGPILVDMPYGGVLFTDVRLWRFSETTGRPIPQVSATIENRTGTAWHSIEFQVSVKCPGTQERSYPMILRDLAADEKRNFTADRSDLAIGVLSPCDAERAQIAFTKGDSTREEEERQRKAELDRAARVAADQARAAYLSKNFVSLDLFKAALMRVIAAAKENFLPILGNRATDEIDGFLLGPQHYSKVTLPRLTCRVMSADLSSTSQKEQSPPILYYGCILDRGYLTPSMKLAYGNLVDTVRLATGLVPYETNNDGFIKTETRPGSGVLEGYRSTLFRENEDTGKLGTRTYIEVDLMGSVSGWVVSMKVGTHWPFGF